MNDSAPAETVSAVTVALALLDRGELRVAEPAGTGSYA